MFPLLITTSHPRKFHLIIKPEDIPIGIPFVVICLNASQKELDAVVHGYNLAMKDAKI